MIFQKSNIEPIRIFLPKIVKKDTRSIARRLHHPPLIQGHFLGFVLLPFLIWKKAFRSSVWRLRGCAASPKSFLLPKKKLQGGLKKKKVTPRNKQLHKLFPC